MNFNVNGFLMTMDFNDNGFLMTMDDDEFQWWRILYDDGIIFTIDSAVCFPKSPKILTHLFVKFLEDDFDGLHLNIPGFGRRAQVAGRHGDCLDKKSEK